MRTGARVLFLMLAALGLALLMLTSPSPAGAMPAFAKRTGKPCAYCHVGAPKNKKLTKAGQCFKEHGFKLEGCEKK